MSVFNRRNFIFFIFIGIISIPIVRRIFYWLKANKTTYNIPGTLSTASYKFGHLLWNMPLKKVHAVEETEIVIVGSGISALSAALELKQKGIHNFKIIELENTPGGNSRFSSNAHGKYPLGAHYLPIPSSDMTELIQFLKSIGVIESIDQHGQPIYNEEYLCSAPQDRLFINGVWQNGLIPDYGVPENDKKEIKHFFEFTDELKNKKGTDNKYLFDFPLERSSTDENTRKLDLVTMKDFLVAEGYRSEYLFWLIDYSCKDDYGTSIEEVSAWAGIHYFCARRGNAVNASPHDVLTWPEGNGWLMQKMANQLQDKFISNALAFQIDESNDLIKVNYLNTQTKNIHQLKCKQVILSCPQFVTKHIRSNISSLRERPYSLFNYSSWMVGNMVVKNTLAEKNGASLSWDNVIYKGKSLGYINSSHQYLQRFKPVLNLTYYYLFSEDKLNRKKVLLSTHPDLSDLMMEDMKIVYPELEKHLVRYDPFVWGHAMIKPVKGFIWSKEKAAAQKPIDNKIFFAHTDLSGISTFEEAFYQGIRVAKEIINR